MALVALKLLFHAAYVPVWEGPDEPFHLARVRGTEFVSEDIVRSVHEHPCAPDVQRGFGCAPFGGGSTGAQPRSIRNYEFHQPPLYYLIGRPVIAMFEGAVQQLYAMRVLSVVLVLIGIFFLRSNADAWLLIMLLPGASEALARCANDAGVFAWCAFVMWAIARKAPTPVLAALALAGPLVKLTAIPVVAFVIAWAYVNRDVWHAVLIASLGLFFIPLQQARGFRWGGTVEMNAAAPVAHDSALEWTIGFTRSTYTFLKTTIWLGEWSFFRAPLWLLGFAALFVLLWSVSIRLHLRKEHLAGLAVACLGTAAFFISHRRLWGQWGGVGGWYAWGWFPWLAVAVRDVTTVRRTKVLWISGVAFVIVANVAWFAIARQVYD